MEITYFISWEGAGAPLLCALATTLCAEHAGSIYLFPPTVVTCIKIYHTAISLKDDRSTVHKVFQT